MSFPRRFLPAMHDLRAFEACARLGSFSAAAVELSLTQSAVSRQIRSLEETLGAPLFLRERQRVQLTHAGERYASAIRDALQAVAGATMSFQANPQGGVLNLAILPAFGTRWLAPRLQRFVERHPGVTINLVTRLAPFEFSLDTVDAAIHYGLADWPGAELDFLLGETVVPACSAALRHSLAPSRASDLLTVPLLHLASRPDAWRRWFRHQGLTMDEVGGMRIDQFATVTQAAISGLGIALLPTFLFQGEFERGELVAAFDAPLRSAEAYYLARPARRTETPALRHFRRWLLAEAGAGHSAS
ncbi:MAG: LysR substrate-binding domain-containing protein [Pigmentiphaga sp.]